MIKLTLEQAKEIRNFIEEMASNWHPTDGSDYRCEACRAQAGASCEDDFVALRIIKHDDGCVAMRIHDYLSDQIGSR